MQNSILYKPCEDSKLLEKFVRHQAKGSVLDMGTGSGIQALAASKNKKTSSILAVDIQKEVIEHCKKTIKNKKIEFLQSNLFEKINKKYDTIIFNPPYLPEDIKVKDLTLDGGKKGYEILERFINETNNYLKKEGIILILFSSLTKKDKIDEFIEKNLLESKLLVKKKFFFEELYVYLVKKSSILKKLENKKTSDIKYFTKGKRGFIFVAKHKNKKVAIKIKNPKSKAMSRIENEIDNLKLLNKKSIGPKLLFHEKDFLVYEFVEGIEVLDFLKKSNKKDSLKIIKDLFNQLFIMDKLNINKEEMSHPHKHIIINNKNKATLLDFERCHYTIKPGNVTQFCDFLISKRVSTLLKTKKIKISNKKMINTAIAYKKNQNKKNYLEITRVIR
jgi:release factor glutamine methyltransferase